ncbi:MAG: HNH endonuclease signature motif containing protein [Bacteriovoracaceae bacterium]
MSTQITKIESTVLKFEKLCVLPGEEWTDHPFVENLVCSSFGRIGNKSRMIIYKGSPNCDGYLKTCLYRNGVSKIWSVHRLVAQAFIGISSLDVNHIDGNKENNRPENLEYLTRANNVRHAVRTGLRKNRSTNVHNSSFYEFAVLTVATYHNAGFGQLLISKIMGVSRGSISSMISRGTYSEFNFLFNKLPRDTHGKYTERAIKEGKWVISNNQKEAV